MTEYVILQKIYGPRRQRCAETLRQNLKTITSGLETQVSLVGQTERGWSRVDVRGNDEEAAHNYLRQRFGEAPRTIEDLKSCSVVKGQAIDAGRVGYGLYVDVGLPQHPYVDALIPLHTLRSQIADGSKTSFRMILGTLGITDNFPLSLRLSRIDQTANKIEAEFTDKQNSMFEQWVADGLDRVLTFGTPIADIQEALITTGLRRDIVRVEPLGLFEQSLLCKLGTEGAGVIGRLGRYLRGIPLSLFSPHRARALLGSPKINLS